MNPFTNRPGTEHSSLGFTLLEVLVAVAIVALGLSGILATINGMVGSSTYLKHKTLANWVAQNHITELRLQTEWPDIGKSTDDEEMAGQDWHIATEVVATPVDNLRRIDVTVSFKDSPDSPLVSVAAFVGQSSGLSPRPDWRAGVPDTPGNATNGSNDSGDDEDQNEQTPESNEGES